MTLRDSQKALIVQEYERREKCAGGLHMVEPRHIVECIAEEMGVTYQVARNVMVDHWIARRGG